MVGVHTAIRAKFAATIIVFTVQVVLVVLVCLIPTVLALAMRAVVVVCANLVPTALDVLAQWTLIAEAAKPVVRQLLHTTVMIRRPSFMSQYLHRLLSYF